MTTEKLKDILCCQKLLIEKNLLTGELKNFKLLVKEIAYPHFLCCTGKPSGGHQVDPLYKHSLLYFFSRTNKFLKKFKKTVQKIFQNFLKKFSRQHRLN